MHERKLEPISLGYGFSGNQPCNEWNGNADEIDVDIQRSKNKLFCIGDSASSIYYLLSRSNWEDYDRLWIETGQKNV